MPRHRTKTVLPETTEVPPAEAAPPADVADAVADVAETPGSVCGAACEEPKPCEAPCEPVVVEVPAPEAPPPAPEPPAEPPPVAGPPAPKRPTRARVSVPGTHVAPRIVDVPPGDGDPAHAAVCEMKRVLGIVAFGAGPVVEFLD